MSNKGVAPVVGVVIITAITFAGGVVMAEFVFNASDSLGGKDASVNIQYSQNINSTLSDSATNKHVYNVYLSVGPISNADFLAVTSRSDTDNNYSVDLLRDGYPENHDGSPDDATDLEPIDEGVMMFNDGDQLMISGLEPADTVLVYAFSENGESDVASTYDVADAIPDDADLDFGTPSHTLQVEAVDGNGDPVLADYSIDGGSSSSFTGSTTTSLEQGDYDIEVTRQSDGSSKTRSVSLYDDRIERFSFSGADQFDVQITGSNSPVSAGSVLEVDTQIQNTGSTDGSQRLSFTAESLGSDYKSVSLNSGESTTRTFTVQTDIGDSGSYTGRLSSNDDSDTQTIEVTSTATTSSNFEVLITNINDPVQPGDQVNIDTQIENTGGEDDTQTVSFSAGSLGSDSTSISLNPGESTSKTFTVSTSSGDSGSYSGVLSSDDSTDSRLVEVASPSGSPGSFDVQIVSINSPVTVGDSVVVDTEIQNTGGSADSQTISIDANSIGSDTKSVSLSPSRSTSETFRLSTSPGDQGSYTAQLSSDDDTDTQSFQVDDGLQDPFTMTVDTTKAIDTSNDKFKITTSNGQYSVRWDGNTRRGLSGDTTLTFSNPGQNQIKIYSDDNLHIDQGTSPTLDPSIYNADAQGIISVDSWGDIQWGSTEHMFSGAKNLNSIPSTPPDLSDVQSTRAMFMNARNFDQDLNNWDTSTVTETSNMFWRANSFNGDISSWDVSNVQEASAMFSGAKSFNQNLNGWDTGNLQNARNMFNDAESFNQDLDNWDTSSVTKTGSMFLGATSFNGDISNWDTSSFTTMHQMFTHSGINQDLSSWDVTNVNSMYATFGNTPFDQDISSWCATNIDSKPSSFDTSTPSTFDSADMPNWGCNA